MTEKFTNDDNDGLNNNYDSKYGNFHDNDDKTYKKKAYKIIFETKSTNF